MKGVVPVAPRGQVGMLNDYIEPSETFVTWPNQDVVNGLGVFSLDEEPMVAQVPEKFFDLLGEALDTVDPLPGEQALYGQFRLVLNAASKDPDLKKVLVATAVEAEQKVVQPFLLWKHNERPAGNG